MSSVRKSFVSKMYSPTTLCDLVAERSGVRVLALERRRQEAADHDAVQRPRRICPGDAENHRRAACARHEIPEPRLADRVAHRDEAALVRVVRAVAEAVDAEIAGRLRGHHAGPCGHGYRRDHRGQATVRAALHETGEGRQLVAPALEDEAGLGAVEPDEHDLPRHAATIARRASHNLSHAHGARGDARDGRHEVRRLVGGRPRQDPPCRAAPGRGARAWHAGRRDGLCDGRYHRHAARARRRDLAATSSPRARHAALHGGAHLVRARRDGRARPRARGRLLHRLAGGHPDRPRPHEGQDPRDHAGPRGRGSRPRAHRARRGLPGLLAGHDGRDDARARRDRCHRSRPRRRARRVVRDLLRRRRGLHGRPAHRLRRSHAARGLLRGDARDVRVGREGAHAARRRDGTRSRRPASTRVRRSRRSRAPGSRTRREWRSRSSPR